MTKKNADNRRRGISLLWEEPTAPSRGPRPSLTPQRIARAAIEIADTDGLEAVSMQAVAAEFGFTTMSLYRYMPGKTELIALMTDLSLGTPPALDDIGDWRARLTVWARHSLDRYRRHPWLLTAASARRRIMGPHELDWLETALAALADTGLSPAEQHDAFLLVNGHVRNVARQIRNAAPGDEDWAPAIAELIGRHAERYPAVAANLAGGGFTPSGTDELDFGLNRILDGLAGYLDSGRAEREGQEP